ncbi:amidohydrolase family protein [Collimonas sp.]|jgi:hypothetical protein|uniref:amidohydrolase family protein n=1 Tax=Collimonas sp. TaxID=1963772 RepID=UPI002CC6F53F|nr:amidohydrolase family protein [Collimonas sp.]HWX03247.1 amidohydrolase family protein [Collimonas sp.]
MSRKLSAAVMLVFFSCFATLQSTAAEPAFDVVILSGRVMDPESMTDRIANIGIRDGRIAEISARSMTGMRTIDAKGLVVAPGFIDLHSHAQYALGYDLQALDGVTTALELEAGVYPVKPFYKQREGRTRINFGASVGLQSIRVKIKTGIEDPQSPLAPFSHWADILPRKAEWAESGLSPAEREDEDRLFEQGFADGGLGLGVLYEYLPGMGRDELYGVLKVAGRLKAPVFVHARAVERADPDHLMAPIQELIADSAATGAPIHICHIGSKGLGSVSLLLDLIDSARKHGVDVSTEVYPYDAGSTAIGSAVYNPGWQERLGAKFEDFEWPPTGERMTAESFARFRRESPGTAAILHHIPEASIVAAVAHRGVMIASDAIPLVNGAGHPRGTGTFARVLGVYVREKQALTLMDAIGKMTLLPAQRLENIAPSMRRKGRVKVGADADLTLFDPATVIDKATYRNPAKPSYGIPYVLVAGVPVVDHGAIVATAFPGRGVRSGAGNAD